MGAAFPELTLQEILARLAPGGPSAAGLAEPSRLPASSKHLMTRERGAGLAVWRRGQLNSSEIKGAGDRLKHYRRFWLESLDRLVEYLLEVKVEEEKKRPSKRKKKH